ncbi:MAG: PAS domain-containing protein [Candidatus Omnitrophota bacterium]|nr:PAS domain-containing protein [Candidatus Omnitrophota bacterium]
MILVKKKYLYVLTVLLCIIVIFGEIRYFHAIESANLTADLDIKYEVENFIFAAIVLFIIVFVFLINFVRASRNILKKLDKMIEVSEYGKYDISSHLNEMGKFGSRIKYLLYYQNNLNEMKSLKISSLSGLNNFLLGKIEKMLFIADYSGNIINCSDCLPRRLEIAKENIIGQDINELFSDVRSEGLFAGLNKKRNPLAIDDLRMKINEKERKCGVTFHPIFNANNEVSHIVGVIEAIS